MEKKREAMKEIKGDLIKMFKQDKFNMIIHGANCQSTMNSGIAKQIKAQFPEAYEKDKGDPRSPEDKLGGFSVLKLKNKLIINAYTQLDYGKGLQVNYMALNQSFQAIAAAIKASTKYDEKKMKIGYPKIGAGLGGGDWNIIAPLIDIAFKEFDHTFVQYER